MENAETEWGSLLLLFALVMLFRYTNSETSGWIVYCLCALVGWSVKLLVSGLIKKRENELKNQEWIKDAMSDKLGDIMKR